MKTLRLVICALAALYFAAALGDGGALRVHNNTSATVTVNAESGYCCTADAGDACSCVLSLGEHTLTATRHDNNGTRTQKVIVTADGFDFQLADGNP